MPLFCACTRVCTARVSTCFAYYWCYSACGCCWFSADVSTALFPLATDIQFPPLSDLQLPPPVTYASYFFSQKNNDCYWLFSLFLPTPSAPSLTSLPMPRGANENSNRTTNSSSAASYLLLSVLRANLGSWGEGLKPKQLLGPYIILHRNLIMRLFNCREQLRGLNTIFLCAVLIKKSLYTF